MGISLSIGGSADAEMSMKGLDTSCLLASLENWKTEGAPTNSGSGSLDDADESESGDSDIVSEPDDDPFACLTKPLVDTTSTSIGFESVHMASAIIDPPGSSVLAPNRQAKKERGRGNLRKDGGVEKLLLLAVLQWLLVLVQEEVQG